MKYLFKEGQTPPKHKEGCKCFRCDRKNQIFSLETKKKMSIAKKGKPSLCKGKKVGFVVHPELIYKGKPWNKGIKGKESHSWKGGITTKNQLERIKFRKEIQKTVFERDNYTCQLCGSKKNLQVDHIQSWAEYVELRFNIDNCRTLCAECHYQITFGKPMPKDIKSWGHNFVQGGLYRG